MRRPPRQFCNLPATSRPATALPCGRHILPLLLRAIGRTSGQGEQLEPRIVSHSDRRRIGCGRSRRCRMRGGEQCDLGPGVRARRAAVQDHVRHDQRRADHRPLHRTVWSTPTAARACNGCCFSAAGSAGHDPAHHSGSAGPAISGRHASGSGGSRDSTEPAVSSPDHDSQSDAATRLCPACARPARTGAGRPATGAACASARAGRTNRLRHHRQRADHRSLHHDLRLQAQRRPVAASRAIKPI